MRNITSATGVLRSILARLRGKQQPPAASPAVYVYQPPRAALTYDEAVEQLAARGLDVRRGQVPNLDDPQIDRIVASLRAEGIATGEVVADPAAFERYVRDAEYDARYPDYYSDNRAEKTFEHFVALRCLDLAPGERVVDLASEHSPVPEIYERLTGAETYAQDIQYPAGIHGRRIGGDACAMPVPDEFAAGATLTCSIEHFEGDADVRLLREMARVLRPGGRLVVAPLYLTDHECVQTDPLYSAGTDVTFDPGAVVYCKPGWGNRHGRFYSPRTLRERLVEPHLEALEFRVLRLVNPEALPAGIYLRFLMVCTRRG